MLELLLLSSLAFNSTHLRAFWTGTLFKCASCLKTLQTSFGNQINHVGLLENILNKSRVSSVFNKAILVEFKSFQCSKINENKSKNKQLNLHLSRSVASEIKSKNSTICCRGNLERLRNSILDLLITLLPND